MRHAKTLLSVTAAIVITTTAYAQPCDIVQRAKLLASDGGEYNFFGYSIAMSGTNAILGAYYDDDNGTGSGSAYLYDTPTSQQGFKLLPHDGAENDSFGFSVGMSGTTAIVGAPGDDDNGNSSGAAYLFDISTGQQLFKLLPNDGAAEQKFGSTVGISGTTAIVGAFQDHENGQYAGAAYLFDTTTGQQILKLFSDDGVSGDSFGNAVAISGTTAIVGAYTDFHSGGRRSGSAYLFDTNTGQQLFHLTANDAGAEDKFGSSVAISGTTAVVGAPSNDVYGADSGAVYFFDTTTGELTGGSYGEFSQSGDQFGHSVAIDGTTAVVGAWNYDRFGTNSGAAYTYDTTTIARLAFVFPDDGAPLDYFGTAVAISGETAVIGAMGDDDNGESAGSAYVFGCPCDSNLCNGDEEFGNNVIVRSRCRRSGSKKLVIKPVVRSSINGQFAFFELWQDGVMLAEANAKVCDTKAQVKFVSRQCDLFEPGTVNIKVRYYGSRDKTTSGCGCGTVVLDGDFEVPSDCPCPE